MFGFGQGECTYFGAIQSQDASSCARNATKFLQLPFEFEMSKRLCLLIVVIVMMHLHATVGDHFST